MSYLLKSISIISLVIGSLMIVIAVTVDWLLGGWPGFGLEQVFLTLVGGILLLISWGMHTSTGGQWARKLLSSPLPFVLSCLVCWQVY